MNKQTNKIYQEVTSRYTYTVYTTRRTITRELTTITTITIRYKNNKRN